MQELAASGSWKHHLCNGTASEGLYIHGTGSWLPKAVTSQAKAAVFDLVTNVLFQELHEALIMY